MVGTFGVAATLEDLKRSGDAPEWLSAEGFEVLSQGYLLPGETPRMMYRRVANSVAKYLKRPQLSDKFYDYIDRNWICLASPVASNSGTKRGLPISCYGLSVDDSLYGIYMGVVETAMLIKHGGGIGKYWGKLRQRGSTISGNGISDGIIPWLKLEEITLQSTSQGGVRRGSGAQYLDINSNEIDEFIELRRNTGDISRRCISTNFHHAVCIDDDFMHRVKAGDARAQELWIKILTCRAETGEPYIMFKDTANKAAPSCYKANNLTIDSSQLCSEIFLFSDPDHTFVCCLSSLNLARYEEWKDSDVVETAIWFLDGVMEEFIKKADGMLGFDNAVRFAKKSRALGLGVVGWHTLLQKKMIPFESYAAMQLNNEIFKLMHDRSKIASQNLALEYGEVQWTRGFGIRNTHLMAVAPTSTNALISGGISQGIEPIIANYYAQKTAKGTFVRKNKQLESLLEEKGKNTFAVWQQINDDDGSVRGLSFLSAEEKAVFATAREINQFAIVRQAAQRQQWIDQGQSVNLFFAGAANLDTGDRKKLGRYIHEVHMEAYDSGLKSLYYLRPTSVLRGDQVYRDSGECLACEA